VDGAANGPDNLQSKQQILQYLKDSFALGHKAMATLNNGNALAPLDKLPIAIPSLNTRLALAIFSFSHASDHYGQMVEYRSHERHCSAHQRGSATGESSGEIGPEPDPL
jgi:hypothetical protein